MNRMGARAGISILVMVIMLLLSIAVRFPGEAEAFYRVQVVDPTNRVSMIDLLEKVQAQVPDAFITREGNTDVIQAGSFSDPKGALQRQDQLESLGVPVQITSAGGEPIALLEASPDPLPQASSIGGIPFHFPYSLVAEELLSGISGQHRLHRDAAQAFQQMQAAAQAEGISLHPLSGYRSWQTQAFLFQRQIQRRGSEGAAKRLSAPPGRSEHHTGFAIDIGDGRVPRANLQFSFDRTPAFQWLASNARSYGFELSFPPNNFQGISYEPWHWRFVQTPEAQSIFASARQSQGS